MARSKSKDASVVVCRVEGLGDWKLKTNCVSDGPEVPAKTRRELGPNRGIFGGDRPCACTRRFV
jgi:hypothetical protein